MIALKESTRDIKIILIDSLKPQHRTTIQLEDLKAHHTVMTATPAAVAALAAELILMITHHTLLHCAELLFLNKRLMQLIVEELLMNHTKKLNQLA